MSQEMIMSQDARRILEWVNIGKEGVRRRVSDWSVVIPPEDAGLIMGVRSMVCRRCLWLPTDAYL
jgi:hypothetical protein